MLTEERRFLHVQSIGQRLAANVLALFADDPSDGRDWYAYDPRRWRTVRLLTWQGDAGRGSLAYVVADPATGRKRIRLANGVSPRDAARIIEQRAQEWATAELTDGAGSERAKKIRARLLPALQS